MKINFDTSIVDLYGEPIKQDGKLATLEMVCCNALMANYTDEPDLSAVEKAKRFRIAKKVAGGGEVNLSTEEITELKKLVGKMYAPLVVGRAYEILDPDEGETKG